MFSSSQIIDIQNEYHETHDAWFVGYKIFSYYSNNLYAMKQTSDLIKESAKITDFLLDLKVFNFKELSNDERKKIVQGFMFGVLNVLIDNLDLTLDNLDQDLDANEIENLDEFRFVEVKEK